MSKILIRLALTFVAASLCAAAAVAQETPAQAPSTVAPEWVTVEPEGEEFKASMPKQPWRFTHLVRAEELLASGRRYTATGEGGARYDIWSLNDAGNVHARLQEASYEGWRAAGRLRYLDLVAEVAWQLLVKPEVERMEAEKAQTGITVEFLPRMSLEREFVLNGCAAREYTLRLEKEGGPVYVCADGARFYVVAALAPELSAADSKRFVQSFMVGPKTPALPPPPVRVATGTGPGVGLNVGGTAAPAAPNSPDDYNRPFKHSEVTKKALITFKPEPGFTEQARRFHVTGVVRLRAILHNSGEMRSITVVKTLPHGLTEKAMDAAQRIRFQAAQKDGRMVSQYVVLEYNFNIY